MIHQGDEGDNFYVLESGQCDVSVRGANGASVIQGQLGPGATFGELSLMYNSPRAATIVCSKNCVLWGLGRVTFRKTLQVTALNKRRVHEDFLKQCTLFSLMTNYERSSLADNMFEMMYEDGQYVCRQGEVGDRFFVILEGEALVTQVYWNIYVHD